jgi:hypothetical protein
MLLLLRDFFLLSISNVGGTGVIQCVPEPNAPDDLKV